MPCLFSVGDTIRGWETLAWTFSSPISRNHLSKALVHDVPSLNTHYFGCKEGGVSIALFAQVFGGMYIPLIIFATLRARSIKLLFMWDYSLSYEGNSTIVDCALCCAFPCTSMFYFSSNVTLLVDRGHAWYPCLSGGHCLLFVSLS